MKSTFAIAAVAGLATVASAQSIMFNLPNGENPNMPIDGHTYVIDVVLDASAYGDSFFAWHQYNFNIGMGASTDGSGLAASLGGDLAESNPLATAVTQTQGAGNLGTNAWDGGRRPGAFPGSASNNGGNRFGPGKADLVSNSAISSSAGTIGGRQQAFTSPESNAFIHIGRVYEAFRFEFTYSDSMGVVTFSLADVVLNLYPNNQSADNVFVQASEVGTLVFAPTPASAALLGLGGLAATRRRR